MNGVNRTASSGPVNCRVLYSTLAKASFLDLFAPASTAFCRVKFQEAIFFDTLPGE